MTYPEENNLTSSETPEGQISQHDGAKDFIKDKIREGVQKIIEETSGGKKSSEWLTPAQHLAKYSLDNKELDFSVYPQKVLDTIEYDENYATKPMAKANAYKRLLAVKMIEKDERGNTVEIAGKVFSPFHPEVDGVDILYDENYPKATLIRGTVLEREVKKAGLKLFDSVEQAREFIDKNMPGSNEDLKILNFVNLLGLTALWYLVNDLTEQFMNPEYIYAYLCYPDGDIIPFVAVSTYKMRLVREQKGIVHSKEDKRINLKYKFDIQDAKQAICFYDLPLENESKSNKTETIVTSPESIEKLYRQVQKYH